MRRSLATAARAGLRLLPRGITLALALSGSLWASGCQVGSPQTPSGNPGSGGVSSAEAGAEAGGLEVRAEAGKPALSVVIREGDPRPAVAAAVAMGEGPAAATAVLSLVEARLSAAGYRGAVDGAAERGGYRVRLLVDDAAAAGKAVESLRAALLAPVGPSDAAGVKLAGARVAALKARPLDDAALVPIVECTGEAVVAPREVLPDGNAPGFAEQIERWRAGHGASSIALSVVGPAKAAEAGQAALSRLAAWPAGVLPADAWAEEKAPAGYVEPRRKRGTARLSVAMRVRDRGAAIAFAEKAQDARSPLVARLSALPQPFSVKRVVGALRRGGACVAVEAETQAPEGGAGSLEEAAAVAASVIRQEITVELGASRDDAQVVARQIRALSDPREAASAAAFWALSGPGPAQAPSFAAALGVAAPQSTPRGGGPDAGELGAVVGQRFAQAMAQAAVGWAKPLLEGKVAAEPGQGELWILLASPCPVVESEAEAGTTALSVITAAKAASGKDNVWIEPWVGPDGAGLLAHASPSPRGESSAELAARVADAVARGLLAEPPPPPVVSVARGLLLGRLEQAGDRGREALATALWPGQPTRLSPWGMFDPVARGGAEAVRLRWAALAAGPMRAAVLANGNTQQAEASLKAVDRWMARQGKARACPAQPAPMPAKTGVHAGVLPPGQAARAFVAAPVDASGAGAGLAGATALLLSGDGGLLRKALEDTGAQGEAYVLGHGATAALVVELRGPEPSLEPAAAQARALLTRLAQGAATDADVARAGAALEAAELSARLDPRRRVAALWRGEPPPALPSLQALRAFHAAQLRDDRLLVVQARPADMGR